MQQIGPYNVNALVDLVEYKHDSAYRQAKEAFNAPDKEWQKASIALRALIEMDRKNADGLAAMTHQLITAIGPQATYQGVHDGLETLYGELQKIRTKQSINQR